MGDIYHAGEVYAGSVPIDDTQASESTVYSSAKTETMIEEVQSDIDALEGRVDAHMLGVAINITSYNSTTNKFTCPSDGYIRVRSGELQYDITAVDIDGKVDIYIVNPNPQGNRTAYNSAYVKKGMHVYVYANTGNRGIATFIPIE